MAIWTTTTSNSNYYITDTGTAGSMTYDRYRNAWIGEKPGYESWRHNTTISTPNSFVDMLRAEIDGWLKGALDI